MDEEYSIPPCAIQALRADGFEPDTAMQARVREWFGWYVADNGWYNGDATVDGRRVKRHRMSLHPARRVCREWTSCLLDDDGTRVSVQAPDGGDASGYGRADAALSDWCAGTGFLATAQRAVERSFALGTGAIALWFDVGEDTVRIAPRRYDARMIVPLSWSDDAVTECAFCTQTWIGGRALDQLQEHVVDAETGTYHIVTRLFEDGHETAADGVLTDFDTGIARPTFCVIRPAVDNVFADNSAFGQSVFADAVDAVKSVDNAFDSMNREIDATKVRVFLSDDLIDVDEKGRPKPFGDDSMFIRKLAGNGVESYLQVSAPPIRIDALEKALNIGLAELGDLTGFGQQYFRFDQSAGLRTATEVSADNSAFFRNIQKHENQLRPALEGLLTAVLDCMRVHNGLDVPDDARATVDFDDSIIADTQSEKNMMLAEVGSGVVPRWMYLARFYGMSEADARAATGEDAPTAADEGI